MSLDWFRLLDDIHLPDRWQLDEPVAEGAIDEIEAWQFTMATVYDDKRQLSVAVDPGRPLDFTLGAFGVPFVSIELARALGEVLGNESQFIPVDARGKSLQILNALKLVDCLDENRSTFTKWGPSDGRPDKVGQYRMVTELWVDPKRAGEGSIFRVRGWDVALIVSQTVKDVIEAGGFDGAVFQRVV